MIQFYKSRVFSFFVILSMLLGAVGIPTQTVHAAISNLQGWTNVYHGTSTSTQNITYTVPTGSNANRVLVVAIASSTTTASARTVTLTYGGQSLTSVAGDMSSTVRQHTQLYYLNEAGLDAASSTTLSFAVSGGTTAITDVWAAVFDGVDQATPITDSKTYSSGASAVDPFQFAAALTVNDGDQAVEVINTTRTSSTTSRTITAATNWTLINEQTGSYNPSGSSNDLGIRNAVANRSVPSSNTTDVSSTNLSGSALASMTAISLKADPTPVINVTSSMTAFSCESGQYSAEQSYTVTGSNLTAGIAVAAPTGFEVSATSGSGFAASINLGTSGGTVYVRLNCSTGGPFSGNITHTSSPATPVDLAVSGAVIPSDWIAYNDVVYQSGTQYIGSNVTVVTIGSGNPGPTSGVLLDQATGIPTGVTAALTQSGTVVWQADDTTGGEDPSSGTDAYNTFYGLTDVEGVVYYGSTGWYVDLTFTGLDPNRTYSFATTANRAGGSTYADRISRYTISDMDAATNESTSGTTMTSTTTAFSTGENTSTGYVARWTGIQPGSDGDFTVRAQADGSQNSAYAFSVFRLGREATGPTITTSGTLTAFTSEPGVPSAEQSYTVAGVNLTDNVVITAPADFEISTTSGSGFGATVNLTPASGTVSATPIYVRFNRATVGTTNGNITHTSTGATTRNVAVGGTAAIPTINVTVRVNQGSDDAEENIGTGAIDLTSTDLELIYDTANQIVGMRFQNIGVPSGATIQSAYIEFEVDETTDVNPSSLTVSGQAADNPTTFTSATNDISTRTKTTASVPWAPGTWGTVDVKHQTPDLSAVVQEIVDRGGWASGNSMVFFVEGTGRRVAESYDGESTAAPLLVIEYIEPEVPTITLTGVPLAAFSSQPGVPSAEQSYTVSGKYLTNDIAITAPSNFEISTTSGSGFGSSVTLTQSGGTVPATPVYVRFNRATQGVSSGDIAHTSIGATTKNVAVTGTASNSATVTFQYGVSGYTGTLDTFIRGTTEGNTNFSANTNLEWDDNTGTTTDEIALVRFNNIFVSDGGPIPDGATITSASLTYMTTDLNSGSTAFGDPANVYESLVDWPNATVTYNNFGGEAGVQADEYSATPTVQATALAISTQYTIDVTANLQRWSSGTANNYGWIFLPTNTDGVNIYSSDFATVANRPLLSVTYSTGPINQAPAQPTLVQPADDATGVSLAPTLEVTVTDPNSDPMDVTFYGRPAGTSTPGPDFTIIAMPDTQHYTDNAGVNAANFYAQTQWIVNNKDALNIVFVTGLGDIVENGNTNDSEWQIANTAYTTIENPVTTSLVDGIPFGLAVGNHDQTPMGGGDTASTTKYNQYFGITRFDGRGYYGGHYGSDNDNNYELFSAGGMDFIIIHFEYDTTPEQAVLDWADSLLTTYSDRRAILTTHFMINIGNPGTWGAQGQAIYNALSDHENLFLMLGGHMHGEGRRQDTAVNGNVVNTLLSDYQDIANGGNGWLRIMQFSPAANTITVTTYSPSLDQYGTDTVMAPNSISAPFTIPYTMQSQAPFELIGTVNNVASGSNASITWPGRTMNTEYEWYAVANDGLLSGTSATWSFTTLVATDTTSTHFNAGTLGDCIVDNGIGDGALRLNIPTSTSCVFTSRILDFGSIVDWTTLTSTTTLPGGTSVGFEARTGNSASPDITWTNWQAANGTLTNPGSRYIQYRATLTTADTGQTPVVQDVTINFTSGAISTLNTPSGTVSNWDKSFNWTGVNGATWYLLEVYTPGGSQLLRKWYTSTQTNCASGIACSLTPSTTDLNLGNGDYQWRVMDYGAYGYGLWTLFKDFTLSAACYTLGVNVSPADSGSVNVPAQSCAGGYTAGSMVQLVAAPGTGYAFTGWVGDASGTTTPVTVLMDGNKSVTANMRGNTPQTPSGSTSAWDYAFTWTGLSDATWYLIEVQTSGGTQVFRQWYTSAQTDCAGGTSCSVTPTGLSLADGDYKWRVLDYGAYGYGINSAFKTFTLSGVACYTLTMDVSPGGSGNVTLPPQTCAGGFTAGSVIQLTAAPNSGYVFKDWSGDAGGTGNPVSVTMNGNKSVTANFKAIIVLNAPSGSLSSWDNTFNWTGLSNATWYLIEVYTPDGSTQVFRKWYTSAQTGCFGGTACSIMPPETAGLASGNYKWRMLDYGAYGYGTWTGYTNFSIP